MEIDTGLRTTPLHSLTRYTVGRGRVEQGPDACRLAIEEAQADVLADAQLDDYHGRAGAVFRWRPPLRLALRARWSHPRAALRGTTGFGFWNDPLDGRGRFVAAPSCLWFFHASAPSRLRGRAANTGFVAGAMRGPALARPLLWAGNLALRLPGVGRWASRGGDDRVGGGDVAIAADLDLTAWHDYAIDWTADGARFTIDGRAVAAFDRVDLPAGPLGFVAWIDNNWSTIEPNGRFRAGHLAVPGRQWLEIASLVVAAAPGSPDGDATPPETTRR